MDGADGDGPTDRRRSSGRWAHLVEHIQDAVVEFEFVANEPIVRSVNQSFVDVFGYDRGEVRGQSLNEYIVPEWLSSEADSLDARTARGEVNYRRVKRATADGLREFLYRGIPYAESETRIDGFAVYTDLTDIDRYERQTRVLNRVLRHDLRNRINVITGRVASVVEQVDGDAAADHLRAIRRAESDLERLTREAARIQEVLDTDFEDDSSIDCVPVVADLVAEYERAEAGAVFEIEFPQSLEVTADYRLRFALDSLIDNAVRHNPADEPRVRISAEPAIPGEWTDLHVEDDGPVIPETERNLVTDHAEITPLTHGSGLGLWLVKWTTQQFGGELSFGKSEMGGNRVTLRLPT